jgi:hypothetical protein
MGEGEVMWMLENFQTWTGILISQFTLHLELLYTVYKPVLVECTLYVDPWLDSSSL